MIERIIYVSRARPEVDAAQAYDIVRTSHNRNAREGLTGALLFIDGHFVQVLEGDPYHVERRYQAICADPRHQDIELRERSPCAERAFASEWMALRLSDEIAPQIRHEFDYSPGLPAAQFPPERLTRFVQACCAPLPG